MKKIVVIDNIIDKEYQENLKELFFNNNKFSWFYMNDISIKDNKHQRRPGFKHIFVKFEKQISNIWPLIKPLSEKISKKIKLKKSTVIEARTFLQLPLNKEYIGEGVDTPHLDRTEAHLVFLYYINDSDGDTIIYNYKSKSPTDIPYFEDIKELKRIKPKQGRVVIFDGLYWHTAEQPTKDVRCIINFNISNNGT